MSSVSKPNDLPKCNFPSCKTVCKHEDNTNEESIESLEANGRVDVSWVQKWEPKTLPEHFSMLICARRRSGKTHLVEHFLKDIKDRFDTAYLFSETAYLQDCYQFIPKDNRYNFFDEDTILKILDRQERLIINNKKLPKEFQTDKNVLIILDDVINDPKVRKSSVLNKIFISGRHVRISIIILSQTISSRFSFPSVILTNCDIGVFFDIHDFYSRETATERFLSIINKKEGMKLLNSVTSSEKFCAIVCDISKQNIQTYSDYVYKIVAPAKNKKFTIGKNDKTVSKKKGINIISLSDANPRGFKLT